MGYATKCDLRNDRQCDVQADIYAGSKQTNDKARLSSLKRPRLSAVILATRNELLSFALKHKITKTWGKYNLLILMTTPTKLSRWWTTER